MAGEALLVILQLAGALAQIQRGDVPDALRVLTAVAESAGEARYAEEALYWRARLAEAQAGGDAGATAARFYVDLMNRLPAGRLRREASVRLAALTQPGRHLAPAEARLASRRNLQRISMALHDWAADNAGRLPRALEGLLDGYLSSALTFVRPGGLSGGGGRAYAYRPGLRAEIGVTKTETGEKVLLVGGVPAVVWEPVPDAEGARLILRLDGEILVVREAREGQQPPEREGEDAGERDAGAAE
jgi:hypothetical protein